MSVKVVPFAEGQVEVVGEVVEAADADKRLLAPVDVVDVVTVLACDEGLAIVDTLVPCGVRDCWEVLISAVTMEVNMLEEEGTLAEAGEVIVDCVDVLRVLLVALGREDEFSGVVEGSGQVLIAY